MLKTRTYLLLGAAMWLHWNTVPIVSGADHQAAELPPPERTAERRGFARQSAVIEGLGIYAEAEAGLRSVARGAEEDGFLIHADDTASGSHYVSASSAENGILTIPVLVPSADHHFLWFRMRATSAPGCALYLSIDSGPEQVVSAQNADCTPEWQWVPMSASTGIPLSPGWHEIKVRARDISVDIDKIALLTRPGDAPDDAAVAEHTDHGAPTTMVVSTATGVDVSQPVESLSALRGFNNMGIVNYGSGLVSGERQQGLLKFQANKYDIFIGGASPLPYASGTPIHTSYRDMSALYPDETWQLKATAEKYGFKYEDMLLHMNTNYTFSDGRYGWAGMGRFDACETWYGGASTTANSSKGVFLVGRDDATYTDATTAAWNTTTADVRIEHRLLLGYCEPFDQVEFQLSTPASSAVTVTWEYWNGSSWTPLLLFFDRTRGLQQNGIVRFYPAFNWRTKSENGSRSKYWVRVSVSGSGTLPVASRILADDWSVPGQPYTWRGWDPKSSTRVNVGLGPLEYNPTPPSTATARFRYQARLLGLWTTNLHFGNPANIQRGMRTWARYLVEASYPVIEKDGANGLFFDDAAGSPSGLVSPAAADWQKHTELAGSDHLGEHIETYKSARNYLRLLVPNARLCANSSIWDLVRHGNCFLIELGGEVHKGAIYVHAVNSDKRWWSSASYDQVAPQNNPGGTKGIFTSWDTAGSDFLFNGSYAAWDRGNRGPITALAAYYIVANDNTRFGYNTEGWIYTKTDHFQYVDETPSFRTLRAIPQNMTADTVKYIFGDFTSFPSQYNSSSNQLMVRIGNTGEYLPVWKVNNNQLATNDVVAFWYPAGTGIFLIREGRQSTMLLPPVERIVMFSNWFPAVGVNLGRPDANGLNGGARVMNWMSAADSGTAGGIQRRDFWNAVVLHATGVYNANGTHLSTYGVPIPLGRVYYPLRSDGRTGPGITSIRLRTAEGAILMKYPIR